MFGDDVVGGVGIYLSRGIYISIFLSDFAPEFIGPLTSQGGGFDSLNFVNFTLEKDL